MLILTELKKLSIALVCYIFTVTLVCKISNVDFVTALHNRLIFIPSKEVFPSPSEYNINYEEIFINTPDGETLHGYFFPCKNKTDKAVIYLHGNGLNISANFLSPLQTQNHVPVNILYADYRGYGKSTGSPSIDTIVTDAESMYDFLIKKGFKSENISLYGESLGGALSIRLAQKVKIKSLTLVSSFSSLRDIAKDSYPFLPGFLVKNHLFNSKEFIKQIKCPVLICHGSKDDIVPVKHSKILFESANEPKKLIILEGADHNNIGLFFNEEFYQALREIYL